MRHYVKIGPPVAQPHRYPQVSIISQQIHFRQSSQPSNIFERVIQHLFHKFLRGKQAPLKIGLAFKLLPHGDNFYIALRPPHINTYATLGREVERHVQSQKPDFQMSGTRFEFKLTAQWNQNGACRNLLTAKLRTEIDISNPNNNYCLVYALLAGIKQSKLNLTNPNQMEKQIEEWARNTDLQTRANLLLKNAGCSTTKSSYNLKDVETLQNYLNQLYPNRYRIIVVETNIILFKGPEAQNLIPIRLNNNHFTLIKNLATHFGVS